MLVKIRKSSRWCVVSFLVGSEWLSRAIGMNERVKAVTEVSLPVAFRVAESELDWEFFFI